MINYNEDEKLMIETVKDFAEQNLKKVAEEVDEKGVWPEKTIKMMAELGLFGIIIPEEYGGYFSSCRLYYNVIRELAKVCASHAITLLSHSFSANIICKHSSEEQKRKYLPKMASGEWLGAIAMTETDSGSDLSNIQTLVKEQENGFLLNGKKQFITNGGKADVIVVLAKSSENKSLFDKSLYILNKNSDGFKVGRSEKKMGLRGSNTSELFFSNVNLDKDSLIGNKGHGMMILLDSLQTSRIATASLALGIAEIAQEEAIKYSKERKQGGKPIKNFQLIQEYLADNEAELECSKLLLQKASMLQEEGKKILKYSSMVKYYCTEAAQRIVDRSLQIHGAYGYTKDFRIERCYRDVRICSIIEGTSEIHKAVIAKNL